VATYLLTWNPANSPWHDIEDNIREMKEIGYHLSTRCVCNAKDILEGDRLFILQQRSLEEHKVSGIGLVASGWAASDVYEEPEKAASGQTARYVEACLDVILNPAQETIFPRTALSEGVLGSQHWDTRSSGTLLEEEAAAELEKAWATFLASKSLSQHNKLEEFYPYQDEEDYEFDEAVDDLGEETGPDKSAGPSLNEVANDFPEEEDTPLIEAIAREDGHFVADPYERDPELRAAAIRLYGTTCQACGFSFEQTYGTYGKGYVQVHHKHPTSNANGSTKIDPSTDLAVLCSNCHTIIHRNPENLLTIEELRVIVNALRS